MRTGIVRRLGYKHPFLKPKEVDWNSVASRLSLCRLTVWYLRQDIIWYIKRNPMPEESGSRIAALRLTNIFFFLTKQPKYYFDGGRYSNGM